METGNKVKYLSDNASEVWKKKNSELFPDFEPCDMENSLLYDMFDSKINKNERFEFVHEIKNNPKNKDNGFDHMLIVGKDNNEQMFIYDPQTGEKCLGKQECLQYLTVYGCKKYLRIDNLDFNEEIVNEVME